MTIALLEGPIRIVVGAAAVALAVAAITLTRRRPTLAGGLLVAAFLLAALIAGEQLVALTVRLAAPDTAEFNEHRWVLLAPWGRLGLALGVVAVAAIGGLAWRASRGAPPWRRGHLVGLRLAAATCALIVFIEPAIELRQVAREPNRIAILVDESRSMSLREDPDGPTRIERVRALLDASTGALATWRREHQIDWYTFDDALAASTEAAIARSKATGDGTRLRKALETVRSRYDGRDLAGVVVISDGATTSGFGEDAGAGAVRDFLRSLETRVHTVWAARPA
jgi:hypothetical protein